MFWLWLGLKAKALARLGVALAQKYARPSQHPMALAWLGLALAQALARVRKRTQYKCYLLQVQKLFYYDIGLVIVQRIV
jgi:hypothetical protein